MIYEIKVNARCAECKAETNGHERLCAIDGVEVWLHPECEQAFFKRGGG
jgi:hypothetical protein